MIHLGDCITVMAGMEPDSVDAVVTDPPYALSFMGKSWDSPAVMAGHNPTNTHGKAGGLRWGKGANDEGYRNMLGKGPQFQAWCEAWGREALRVTKPGGYLLAFGGTRTHHRLVCGLEDAGWIIRDELDWIYASGFPKGKANLKPAHEPIVLARKPGPLRPLAIDATRIGTTDDLNGGAYTEGRIPRAMAPGGEPRSAVVEGPFEQPAGRWPSNVLLSDPALFDEPNPEVVGSGAVTVVGNLEPHHTMRDRRFDPANPTSDEKHRNPSQSFGGDSGGYSRFFIIPKADRGDREPVLRPGQTTVIRRGTGLQEGEPATSAPATRTPRGAPVFQTYCVKCGRQKVNVPGSACQCVEPEWSERGVPQNPRSNSHPTVKPTDLMRHLIRLVTPPGGTVLDCFLGSGSTAIAAELEGFAWIGIEKEPEYVAIAEARLNGTQRGLGLDVPAPTRKTKLDPRVIAGKGPSRPEGASASTWFTTGHQPDEEPAA